MQQGVKVDTKKIEAMVAWSQPTNIAKLHKFLGLIGYYWKFTTTKIVYGVTIYGVTFKIMTP